MNSQPRNALHVFFRESLAAKQQIAAATQSLAERQVKREDIPGLVIELVRYLGQNGSCKTVDSIPDPQQRHAAEHLGFNDASLKDLCRAIYSPGAGPGSTAQSAPPASSPPGKGAGQKTP